MSDSKQGLLKKTQEESVVQTATSNWKKKFYVHCYWEYER